MPTDPGTGAFNPTTVATTSKSATALPVFADGTTDIYSLGDQNYFTGYTQIGAKSGGTGGGEHYTAATQTPEYTSAQSILNQLVSLSVTNKDQFSNIQAEMYNAGMYSSKPTSGNWTAKDGDALSEALRGFLAVEQSGGAPVTFSEWLASAAAQGAADGGPDGGSSTTGSAPAQISVTDAATLDSKANAAAQTDLGRNLSAGEQAKFVQSFQGQEIAAQTSTSGVVADPSRYDAQNAADQDIQSQDNPEYQGHLQADYAEKMLSMLGVQQ